MPSTPTDLATLITGGSQPKTDALLKGAYAALNNAKSTPADTGSSSGSDFASLLDSPDAKDNPAADPNAPEGEGRGLLANDIPLMSAAPLQIKGMNCRLDASTAVPVTEVSLLVPALEPADTVAVVPVAPASDEPAVEPESGIGSTGQDAPISIPPRAEKKLGVFLRLNGQAADTPHGPAHVSARVKPSDLEEGDPSGLSSRRAEYFSRFGYSALNGSWQPRITTLSGTRGQIQDPAHHGCGVNPPGIAMPLATAVAPVLPVAADPAATTVVPSTVAQQETVTSVAVSLETSAALPAVMSIAAAVTLPDPAITQTEVPTADLSDMVTISDSGATADEATPDPVIVTSDPIPTDDPVDPADGATDTPATTSTCHAPAYGLHTHALLHRPMGEFQLPTGDLLPAVENHLSVDEVPPGTGNDRGNNAPSPLSPELRREVVETIAALLAPLLHSLSQVTAEASPVTSSGSGDDAGVTDAASDQRHACITVKVSGQPPITLELPHLGSVATDTTIDTTEVMPASDQTSTHSEEESPVLNQVIDQLTAQDPSSVDLPALDFRVALATEIETAWAKQESLLSSVAPDVLTIASDEAAGLGEELDALGENSAESLTSISEPLTEVQAEGGAAIVAAPLPADGEETLPLPTLATAPASQEVSAEAITHVGTPVEVVIELPEMVSLTAQILSSVLPTSSQDKKSADRAGRTEKYAGESRFSRMLDGRQNSDAEKTFLNVEGELLRAKSGTAGTDVAKTSDSMPAPFTSRRVTVDQLEFPPRLTGRELFPILNETPNATPSAETSAPATPAPVLAHRAVETILNVVEAQRQNSANASSVNLHFKFGADDLAVRVQMRGGEVQTQFLTDSAELRSALNSEWQVMAGQGGAAGLRLLDPVIMPASASVSSGFGNASQGQNHAQQQAQQHQHGQAAAAFPELRELRRGNRVTTPAASVVAPRVSVESPTSQHLTALA